MTSERYPPLPTPASSGRTRVLFIAEAVTLAHVARAHALARQLDPERHDICIASDPRYDAVIGSHGFRTRCMSSISTARFAHALSTGSPIYDTDTLASYVEEDLRAIADFSPDVVIGDFRLSLNISARLAGKPYINVAGAGWSPYADMQFTVPDIALTRITGVRVAQMLFDMTRGLAFRAHARPLNVLRKRHGMHALPADLRVIYTDADHVLYADVPELFVMRPLPANHEFVGAVLWSPESALPTWWDTLPADRPIVYVTLGSSGDAAALGTILAALARERLTVVAATAGRVTPASVPANAFVADFIPGSAAAHRSSLVICNGGSATCYQALAAGVPILGIPSNLDQFLTMSAIEAFGAGKTLRTQALSGAAVNGAIETIGSTGRFRLKAEQLKIAIDSRSNGSILANTIRQATGSRVAVAALR